MKCYTLAVNLLLIVVNVNISPIKSISNNSDPYIITNHIVLAAVDRFPFSTTPTCFNTLPKSFNPTTKKVLLTERICTEQQFELRWTKPLVYEEFYQDGTIRYLRRIKSVGGRKCLHEGLVCKSCSLLKTHCKTFNQSAKQIVVLKKTSTAGIYLPVSRFYLLNVGRSCTCVTTIWWKIQDWCLSYPRKRHTEFL